MNGMADLNWKKNEELIASTTTMVSLTNMVIFAKESQSKRLENSACNAEFAGHCVPARPQTVRFTAHVPLATNIIASGYEWERKGKRSTRRYPFPMMSPGGRGRAKDLSNCPSPSCRFAIDDTALAIITATTIRDTVI